MKNKFMRAATLLMALTLMTSCFVGGTFAKYTSTQSGSDTARVAKWSFNVGDTNIAKTETVSFDFNVFETIMDETANSDDAEVYGDKVIAPGTRGQFVIELANTSEVDAMYAIEFTETDGVNPTAIPLWYSTSVNGTWTQDISALNIAASSDTQLDYNGGAKDSDSVTVYWKWLFEGTDGQQTDTSDTVLGIYSAAGSAATVTVTAKVTATQVD